MPDEGWIAHFDRLGATKELRAVPTRSSSPRLVLRRDYAVNFRQPGSFLSGECTRPVPQTWQV
jgi:hypothetical protein